MARTDDQAARELIDALPEPRRSQMLHLHGVIQEALPDIEIRLWDYSGDLIGYGTYPFTTSRGPAGEWFPVGLASRKRYISLYSMGLKDGGYLVEAMRDRFPGTKTGKSCINITKPELIDDDAVRDLVIETLSQYRDRLVRPPG